MVPVSVSTSDNGPGGDAWVLYASPEIFVETNDDGL